MASCCEALIDYDDFVSDFITTLNATDFEREAMKRVVVDLFHLANELQDKHAELLDELYAGDHTE